MRSSRLLLAWSWTLLVFALCWTPRQFIPEEQGQTAPVLIPHLDKIVHFGLFAGFTSCWLLAGSLRPRWVVVVGVAVAVITELGQQTPIVNRDASWGDGFADVFGILGGILADTLIGAVKPRSSLRTVEPDESG